MNELTYKQMLDFKKPAPVWVTERNEYGLAFLHEVMFFGGGRWPILYILQHGGKIYKAKVAKG
ncbi:hypothetical protein CE91St43_05360 [Oscillospiraceae bacterium]|nr:hypothetical protein CE91St43_05360 [Oscillospiraceae bacterium]